MIHSVQFSCVLDTNVIYPIDIRDLLFWLAYYELYTPKWSKHIFDEWKDVMIRKGVSEGEANQRINKAQLAVKVKTSSDSQAFFASSEAKRFLRHILPE